MSALEIKNVSKLYPNGKQAITDASISINYGEFVVFVGPSGCGKSSLLRMIAGLETISDGEMVLGDTRINELEPAERDIAMVFQNYALYPHMTVYKNLAYGLINRKYPKEEIEKRVQDTAQMLQLSEYLHSKPSELSGGQRQRVAMGRAIVREPKLFLFDEPLSNLDAKLRNTMRLEIKALQRRLNTTTVYVTHDQVEAMTMADKIVLINNGHIEQIGTPYELYHNPANMFVATFIGSPAMNMLNATLKGKVLAFDSETHIELPEVFHFSSECSSVSVGVRAECLSITDTSVDEGFSLPVYCEAVEDLGAHRIVHCQIAGQTLLTVSSRTDIKEQCFYYINLSLDDLYLFDIESGQNISHHFRY